MPDNQDHYIDRNLALEVVRVTEAAALAASLQAGRGDELSADYEATAGMHRALNSLSITGHIVIGQGERDKTEKLYTGEIVGQGGVTVDIALDPLEGKTIAAKGGENALSVIAIAENHGFLHVPNIYMEKIAIGPGAPVGLLDLDAGPEENLRRLAAAKVADISELLVCIIDRPRHGDLIARIRATGARIMLISDGDISGVIATTQPKSGVDMYMGIGGAPEGVLAAAALRCTGGEMQARLYFRHDDEKMKAGQYGIEDLHRIYSAEDLARGDVVFAATGVTNGAMVRGVRRFAGGAVTHSVVMRSKTGTVRWLESHHDFRRKPAGHVDRFS